MKKLEVRTSRIPGEALLLLTAAVWGTGFVAQRKAMEGMQPFAFIALRFFLGCLVLLPVLILRCVRQKAAAGAGSKWKAGFKRLAVPGMISGLFLFAGTSLQQLGIITTSASKAGFLTSLYLVLVPLLGLLVGKKVNLWVWIGVVLALAGVWFLSLNLEMSIQRGDILILIGALFWALQILALDRFTQDLDPLGLAFGQFFTAAILGLVVCLITEKGPLVTDSGAWMPLLYSGVAAVGIGFTLQVVGQSMVDPALATLILSLEAVFALLGGMIFLGERLSGREWWGCGMMLAAVILVQLKGEQQKTTDKG
ncbi:MAG TPA: DMT family transporter [Anaerolineaceae bacterium]|mgnify:FL=1|jgi:drug/metabolite transporter (DMT)-like permease|nr:DMT family transporter [Anaerolineaceae bacterium]